MWVLLPSSTNEQSAFFFFISPSLFEHPGWIGSKSNYAYYYVLFLFIQLQRMKYENHMNYMNKRKQWMKGAAKNGQIIECEYVYIYIQYVYMYAYVYVCDCVCDCMFEWMNKRVRVCMCGSWSLLAAVESVWKRSYCVIKLGIEQVHHPTQVAFLRIF